MSIIEMQELIDSAGNAREAGRRDAPVEAKLTNAMREIMTVSCSRIIVSGKAFKAIVCKHGWVRFERAVQA